MARTGAERQSAYLGRQRELGEALRSEAASLRGRVALLEDENRKLRRTVDTLSAALEAADAQGGQPSGPDCQHPSEAVSDGRCTACGDWL